jgi:L-threonylcarbamoyladenylate synthase
MNKIVDILRDGGVAALPTDNLFCLAADASNETAVNKVFEIKGRSNSSAIPILIADFSDVEKYTINQPDVLELIVKQYWPGRLTIVLKRAKTLAPNISPGMDTIAIRIPNSDFIRSVIRDLGNPITGTSANLSGESPAISSEQVELSLGHKLDFIYKNTTTLGGLPSTVLDLSTMPARILRHGAVEKRELKSTLELHKLDLS